jgi:hypothetical protein
MSGVARLQRALTGSALIVAVAACAPTNPTAAPPPATVPPTAALTPTTAPTSPLPTMGAETPTVPATAAPVGTAVIATVAAPATAIPTAGEAIRRIQFPPGGTSANVEGDLLPAGSARYVLGAQGGQTLFATVTTSQGQAALSIAGADGTVLISPMGGVNSWSGVLPSTQDYYITVRGAPDMPTHYLLSVSIPPLTPPGPDVRRITFPPGGTSATVQGRLAASGTDRYVLGARAGQTMDVRVVPATGTARLVIYGADGTVLVSGMADTDRWVGPLPFTEDYFIDVQAGPDGPTNYALTVTIPPP